MAVEVIATIPGERPGEHALRFADAHSGCFVLICTPRSHPELWQQFMDGALRSYQRFGVEEVLAYDSVVDGLSTSAFVVALDETGKVVAGTRVQGPYQHVDEAHAVTEWAGHPGELALRRVIADRIPEGVVEFKSAWIDHKSEHRGALRNALARTTIHIPQAIGVRYALSTAADTVAEGWRVSGGTVAWWIPSVPYPNDQYATVALWWDMRTYERFAVESQLPLIEAEQAELAAQRVSAWNRAAGLAQA
ncbi:hypothetical protein [Nocardia sp. NPDC127526]|uniref:hypothetical protein n=1 Tax=Nocardia sp. NPDC127526 TaxID=3345393 RepID=UPI0036326342